MAAVELAENRYGKSRVRLMKVVRSADRSEIADWTVAVMLEGDFRAAHVDGDNAALLPTDTMKNTVYSLARQSAAATAEEFAQELVTFLLSRNPQVSAAEVRIESALWKRLTVDGQPDASSFMRGNEERQTVAVRGEQGGAQTVTAGLANMVLLKTSRSSFSGFLRDSLTTLPETDDRLLGTAVEARWTYRRPPASFAEARERVREALLRAFATHDSSSVQHTLFTMGRAAIEAAAEIDEIDLVMPNRHYLLVDLSRFGQDNPNQVFVATEEPHGTIEARVRRSQVE